MCEELVVVSLTTRVEANHLKERTDNVSVMSLALEVLLKNWARKLFDNQKEKLLDKQNSSNQPNQSQNQSVIYQGNLTSRKT